MNPVHDIALVVVAVAIAAALVAVAGLLTVATFTSVRDLIRNPLSTLPTEPLDIAAPRARHRRTRRRLVHAGLDLRATYRAALDA